MSDDITPLQSRIAKIVGDEERLNRNRRSALFDGGIYVNVQTSAYPNGEIRGQLLR